MFKFIGATWKFFWQGVTSLRTFLFNFIFLLIVIVIITSVFTAPDKSIPNETALLIAPQGYLVDQRTYKPTPSEMLFGFNDRVAETPLLELTNTIRQAADDKRITALVFQLDQFVGGGLSKMEELGQAITHFKESGKPVYAFADNYSQQQYFLASYANKIYMNDMGNLLLTGFGMYRNYYQQLSDKLSLKFHVFRVGDYKDAVEPYMRNGMSDESREHNARWINELWQRYTNTIARNRDKPETLVSNYIGSLSIKPTLEAESLSSVALAAGLVDELGSRADINLALVELLGKEEDGENFKAVDYQRYRNATLSMPNNKAAIGLIVATGTIVDGHRDKGMIGGESLISLIKQAREDKSLKALVIRVNSGGGSAFASEMIRDEIVAAGDDNLPVYISMGSVAASGGYWIATPAKQIWATPATITGSIGVWGLLPNVSDSIERLGIHSDGVGTTALSDIYHIERPLSGKAKNLIQRGVNDVYSRFLTIVAEARESDPASVHEIAGGRVWTGEAAKSLGLVDNLGSLHDLFNTVASTENLDDYQITVIEKPLSASEEIMRVLMDEVSVRIQTSALSGPLQNLMLLKTLNENNAITGQLNSLLKLAQAFNVSIEAGEQPPTMAHCLECYAP